MILILFLTGCSTAPSVGAHRSTASAIDVVTSRNFPSVFQAWRPIVQPAGGDPTVAMARHDLVWQSWSAWGLKCSVSSPAGACNTFSSQSVNDTLKTTARLKQLNPNIILFAEIRYHDAVSTYLPDDSPWWKRDAQGNRISKTQGTSTDNYFLLDFANPDLQDKVASLCKEVVATGAVDGCMFDWWNTETPAHIELIKKVRAVTGDSVLLIANVNGSIPIQTAPYLNGIYMEGFGASFFKDWRTAKSNLLWAERNLQAPVITAFDAWGDINSNDSAMRFPLALSLIFSDGYFLYGDKLHQHIWHSIWEKNLGKSLGPVTMQASDDGTYRREFENGTVVLNPPGNHNVNIKFTETRTRASDGAKNSQHLLQAGDGDFFLR